MVAADPVASIAYGRTVDAVRGRPVPFVLVVAYEEDYTTVIGVAISNRRGPVSARADPARPPVTPTRWRGLLRTAHRRARARLFAGGSAARVVT